MWIKVFLFCVLTLFAVQLVSARWCTRLKAVKSVQTYIEYTTCNQSYEAACGWLTRRMCTHYEIVDCHKQHNRTITFYKIVEECCRGYQLDSMNITCVEISAGGKLEKEVTTVSVVSVTELSPADPEVSTNGTSNGSLHAAIGAVDKDSVHYYYESDDNLLWGLSHGAYAGIICSVLFVLCVVILVLFRVRKRHRNARLKAANNSLEMDMRAKMISNT